MKQCAWFYGSLSIAGAVVSWSIIDIASGPARIIGWVALCVFSAFTGYFIPYIVKQEKDSK